MPAMPCHAACQCAAQRCASVLPSASASATNRVEDSAPPLPLLLLPVVAATAPLSSACPLSRCLFLYRCPPPRCLSLPCCLPPVSMSAALLAAHLWLLLRPPFLAADAALTALAAADAHLGAAQRARRRPPSGRRSTSISARSSLSASRSRGATSWRRRSWRRRARVSTASSTWRAS